MWDIAVFRDFGVVEKLLGPLHEPLILVLTVVWRRRCHRRYRGQVSAALVLGGVDVTGPHLHTVSPKCDDREHFLRLICFQSAGLDPARLYRDSF